MIILSKAFPGLLATCDKCGSLLAYNAKDIYGTVIYCPLCKNAIEVPLDKEYNGVS